MVWWTSRWRCRMTRSCSIGFGFALISGNVANFLLVGYVLVWRYRDRPWIGALIGLMAIAKLFPIVFAGFLLARRDARQVAWLAVGLIPAAAISLVGAGLDAHVAYLGVLERSAPQFASLAYLTGVREISVVLFVAGIAIAARLRESWSYAACLLTLVFAAPTLAWAQLVALLPLLMLTWPDAGLHERPSFRIGPRPAMDPARPPTADHSPHPEPARAIETAL